MNITAPPPVTRSKHWKVEHQRCTSKHDLQQHKPSVPVLVSANDSDQTQWMPGERLHHLFERQVDELGWRKMRRKTAVEYESESYTYGELDKLSTQFARFLLQRGVTAGTRIALLVDRSIYSHAAVLAISKIEAAYVPLDASFPSDRIDFILSDSNASLVLTLSHFMEKFNASDVPTLAIDTHRVEIDGKKSERLKRSPSSTADSLCYIIYTSGTTGRPKGVPIYQSSLCNFLYVARDTYQYQISDRVYQGMTVAFDFSIEELWVPLVSGATIVPAPCDGNLVGEDLAEFIRDRRITALCCVPTLLATIESDLPSLRFLMVSGEACPDYLAKRWTREDRRFLNTYGPTEATVSATWLPLAPEQDINIGGPLPTYSIVILDQDKNESRQLGQMGEIGIAGIGLAGEYLGLPDQSNRAYIDDFIGLRNNPGGKIYRTGDLGMINANCQIEFLGRVDTQVKIRGYRIELDEIEAVLRDVPGIKQAVVNPFTTDSENTELVAYYQQADNDVTADVFLMQVQLRERLPVYMVPTFFEPMSDFPLLPSGKLDRNKLPKPTSNRLLATGKPHVHCRSQMESVLAEHLAAILQIDTVSADADFFADLGANSLLIAQLVARLRKSLGIRHLSLKNIYQHSSIQQLAQLLETKQAASPPAAVEAAASPRSFDQNQTAADERTPSQAQELTPHVATKAQYVICGVVQAASAIAITWLSTFVFTKGFHWINTSTDIATTYFRAAEVASAYFVGVSALLIAVKWLAIGRFDDKQPIPLWGLQYIRFWIARSAVRSNPLNLTRGTPLYSWYLRLLGAKIGKRVTFFAQTPTCVDLLSIGDDTIIREDAKLTGYAVLSGYVHIGRVTVGSRSFVGEATVMDINTRVGDDAQLGTNSALYENDHVPNGKIYQGSPAEETTTNYNRVPPREYSQFNRVAYSAYLVLSTVFVGFPLIASVAYWLTHQGLTLFGSSHIGEAGMLASLSNTLLLAVGLTLVGLVLNIARVMIVPRLIQPFLIADKIHPLFGIQYHLARLMAIFSNSRSLNQLFGDSSLIVHYLSFIGFDMSESTQTGSNFGAEQKQGSPFLCKFSRNTLVSDGLKLQNADLSNTSFKISQITMPADTYLGNDIHYPADSRVGTNCLVGTKAMIPIDGEMREGVGILGSPPFEIPRSVLRDQKFDHYKEPAALAEGLKNKLRSNLQTLALHVLTKISRLFFALSIVWFTLHTFAPVGASNVVASDFAISGAIMAGSIFTLLFTVLHDIFFERMSTNFKSLKPLYCSLYDRRFWNHERYWKMSLQPLLQVFSGTPMKAFFLRLRGMKVGSLLFDDGAGVPEPTLVSLGDNCCLNQYSVIQSHSLEDGVFKSDHISIGSHCNIGVGAFVHYSTQIDNHSTVLSNSFVMKGTVIESDTIWAGNPAKEVYFEENDIPEISQTMPHAMPTAEREQRIIAQSM